ncbi:hypothetical protein J1N35_007744 [Gossypium stocksii]|uniref:AMP-dependent synthetase/ligase domain-containing protein n=1 Tax=Gossypium stocksii TaxID=47602 RepID=A0A9D3W723_9ROSI|nr:hypothetical protein J1N35_007744 [Gossypium stocksii]
MAAIGGTNIFLRKVDLSQIYRLIKQHKVTHMCAPVILMAGSPPPTLVVARIMSMGFVVSHGYGLIKTGGMVVSCA